MTDWTPPGAAPGATAGSVPPAAPAATPAPATPAPPPPVGAPRATSFGAPSSPPPPIGAPRGGPPPRRRPRWVLPVAIGAGSLALLGLLAGGVVLAVQLGTGLGASAAGDPDPVAEGPADGDSGAGDPVAGDPAAPVAESPLECEGCFDDLDARAISPEASLFAEIGLPVAGGEFSTSTVGAQQRQLAKAWRQEGGTPDACYFSYPDSPIVLTPDDSLDSAAPESVTFAPWYADEDEVDYVAQATRLFPDSAAAAEHMLALEAAVAGCPVYRLDSGWAPAVDPAGAFELPPEVAGYGWVESSGGAHFFAADLQRGNLVTRVTMWSDLGGPDEAEFRSVVDRVAQLLADLEPATD